MKSEYVISFKIQDSSLLRTAQTEASQPHTFPLPAGIYPTVLFLLLSLSHTLNPCRAQLIVDLPFFEPADSADSFF